MIFNPTPLPGVYTIDLRPIADERGFFARVFSSDEFAKSNLDSHFVQVNNSLSTTRYTLRGMHYQSDPKAETKLVRCIQGALYDVVLDLRPSSPTFGHHFGAELTAHNRTMMYVPKGCAHGFLTLQENTEVIYLVSEYYSPPHERGVRWNDPYFNIQWPAQPTVLSEKDRNRPDYKQ